MSTYERAQYSGINEKSGRKIPILLGTLLIMFMAGLFGFYVSRLGFAGLASSVVAWVRFNLSPWRITLIVGFGGSLLSIPFLRRRNRKGEAQVVTRAPVAVSQRRAHPLLLTPRPSRDSRFVIRKTKHKGRIARNRDGERLPPTQHQ